MTSQLTGIQHVLFRDPTPLAEPAGVRRDALVRLIKVDHDLGVATKGVAGSWMPKAVPSDYGYTRAGWAPLEYRASGGNPTAFRERMTSIADSLDVAVSTLRQLHPVDGKALAKSLHGTAEHARGLTRVSDLHLTHQYDLPSELASARSDAGEAYALLNRGPTSVLGHGELRPWVVVGGLAALAGAVALGVHARDAR